MCRISNIATTEYNIIANLDATIESAQTSDRVSAVLSCGNVDFGVATPLQQYKETYRIVHTCDTTPQNIMAEKINIKLVIEEITKSHQRCCNAKILRCHAFRQNDATITSMQCRLQDVWRQTLVYLATFKIHGDASTKSRKFDKGHVINSEDIKKR
uniref:Uncharacterized protein n=1 Tax=Vespula pensylvanica TaxID=30213 RepID=A0A834UF30_VESPE|nr:hypothetical protein H0235_003196 [Vespula pensylvanica]